MKKFIHNALGSWITTAFLGVPGVIEVWTEVSKWLDEDPATTMSTGGLILGIGLIIGGMVARDGNKSSEEVGAK